MKQAAKVGLQLLSQEKPHSSISVWIDTLCQERYEEDDYDGITELVESINLQTTGPTEASRSIRKKLKYSNVHGQLRALTILKALVENCGPRFQATFANERLIDRIKVMSADPTCDEKVKKKIMNVLRNWFNLFKEDKSMQLVAGLYASCGGGKKTVAYDKEQERYSREASDRAERKMQERKQKEKERERLEKEKADKKNNKNKPKVKRVPFNFEAEKPKIMATVGSATQSAQNLINALQLVNRERESITTNERVVECLAKAKADRKIVVRYIQQVENDADGDYIGTLLSTNEQVLTALALYDRYSKPVDLDSDDEYVAALQNTASEQGLRVPNLHANDDTMSIRSRLSAFDIRDNEVDKLQERQWRGIERENNRRNFNNNRGHPDLQDLAFGPTPSGSSLPPPIQPSATTPGGNYSHGSLAEYSDGSEDDYSESSDGEEVPAHFGAPPTSFSSSTAATSTSSSQGNSNENDVGDARSYARFIQKDDARFGKGLLAEEEEEEEDDDPFSDSHTGGGGDYGYDDDLSVKSGRRKDWREV